MASESMGGEEDERVDFGLPPAHLTAVVVGGVAWKALARATSAITRVVVLVVLARLLTPADFGVAGMALVVMSFAMIFTDPGLGAVLVQRPTIDERDRSTVFWIAATVGSALTIVGVATAGLVADFFGEPQVRDLLIVISFSFLIVSLSIVHRALLARKLAYRALEIREMVSIVTGGAVAISFALAGFGPFAVVGNHVAYAVMSTVLVWLLYDWRPHALFSIERARGLVGFSAKIFSSVVLSWTSSNVDKALVGRSLGAAPLGAYSVAFQAMTVPSNLIGRPLQQVLTPAYSRIQEEQERLERAWLRSKRLSMAVMAPALVGLIVVATDFVHVLFGERWDDAVVPLQLLCLGGLANALAALHWGLLQARGEAGVLLRITLLASCVTVAAVAAGLAWGLVGVAAFYAGARWLLVVPTLSMMARAVSFDFWRALRAGAAALPIAVGAGAVAFGAREAFLALGIPAALRLVLVAAVITAVYSLLVLVFTPSRIDEIREILRQRRLPEGA